MLILCRKENQGVRLGEDVEIVVLSVTPALGGYEVRLGFIAPQQWRIVRSELAEGGPLFVPRKKERACRRASRPIRR